MSSLSTHPSPVIVRHGRRFHGTGSNYGLPNDEREHTRLDYQHEAIKLILGSNYTAPLAQLNSQTGPKDILDVGSGSGVWVVEMAREFPNARVVGIDMSEPQLLPSQTPKNASFVVADITRPLAFEAQSFDVVQMRIVPSIHERTLIYREINRVLRPGGIIQLVEPGGHVSRVGRNPPAMEECNRAIIRSGHKNRSSQPESRLEPGNRRPKADNNQEEWSLANRIAQDLHSAPWMWMSVHEDELIVPIGVWTDDGRAAKPGRLMKHCAVELIRGFRPNLIDNAGLTGEQVDAMVSRLAEELEDGPKWQLEAPFHFVWARKN